MQADVPPLVRLLMCLLMCLLSRVWHAHGLCTACAQVLAEVAVGLGWERLLRLRPAPSAGAREPAPITRCLLPEDGDG